MNKIKLKIRLLVMVVIILSLSFIIKPAYAATTGQVVELLFNEGTGVIVNDSSGFGNNAIVAGAKWVKLPSGKWVLSFNGKSDNLSCNYSPLLDFSGPIAALTMEAWFSMGENKSTTLIGTGSSGNAGGYSFYYNETIGRVCGYIGNPSGWKANIYEQTLIEKNTWHHIVYTYDGDYGRIYLDGNLEGASTEWTGGMSSTAVPFHMNSQFAGMIGKISVFDFALSQDRIQNIYLTERDIYLPINRTIYVYPAISDIRVLPTTIIPDRYISDNISVSGVPSEYRSASFVIYTPDAISALATEVSDLTGPKGVINKSAVDIRIVKCWYQAGYSNIQSPDLVNTKAMVPELLLKDDTLVNVEGEENYVKLQDGSYRWISRRQAAQDSSPIPIVSFPVKDDAATLQVVDIPARTNKQFWVTVKIPNNATAGTYAGTISLNQGMGIINLNLVVLPITLLESQQTYSVYYAGELNGSVPAGSIGLTKSETQLAVEMADMKIHGINNPAIYQPWTDLTKVERFIQIMQDSGFTNSDLFYLGLQPSGYQNPADVKAVLAFMAQYDITDVYFYGVDEAEGMNLVAQRSSWQAIRAAGGKMFVAGWRNSVEYFNSIGDLLDLFIYGGAPSAIESARWHSIGHKIFAYNNPQLGLELPETYRKNYGLLLWQQDYDGTMVFAYQGAFGNLWNDWDDPDNRWKDHVVAYPTSNGVINTVQWEGFREGVNDARYITTLLNTIKTAKGSGKDTSAAESWLTELKNADLTTRDLDSVRSQMIDFILSLQEQQPVLSLVTVAPSNISVELSGSQHYTAQGYDSNSNPIEGLIYTWSVTNPTAGTIDSNGLFTAGSVAGRYSDVIRTVSGVKIGTASVTITQPANQPPVLNPIGDKTVIAGSPLIITISASDPDGDNLTYSASGLPEGAGFNPSSQVFSWTPGPDQTGIYDNLHFKVADNSSSNSETIVITVNSPALSSGVGGGGGGGGGGSPAPAPAPAPVSTVPNIKVNGNIFTQTTHVKSDDNLAEVIIDQGTLCLLKEGEDFKTLSVTALETPPTAPKQFKILGRVYDLRPDGATFDKPLSLTFSYDPSLIPAGTPESELIIATWDPDLSQWINLESKLDLLNQAVTTRVSHFSLYAILAPLLLPASTDSLVEEPAALASEQLDQVHISETKQDNHSAPSVIEEPSLADPSPAVSYPVVAAVSNPQSDQAAQPLPEFSLSLLAKITGFALILILLTVVLILLRRRTLLKKGQG